MPRKAGQLTALCRRSMQELRLEILGEQSAEQAHLDEQIGRKLGLAHGPVTLKLGQELLGGDASRAGHRLLTPLATLHAFQGWADKFLVTPPQGVDDRYATLEAEWHGLKAAASYHDYGAEALARDYGHEWNASLSRRFAKRFELLGKYADYSASGFGADTRKAWLMLTATF